MARYQAVLAYDGTDFSGFQRQADVRTVQGVLEQALITLGWQGDSLLAAGRTDSGVHASGQVVAFDLAWRHPPGDLRQALNANLPADLAVQAVSLAAADFHPRYQAVRRCYHYRVLVREVPDPLRERYAWRVWPAPDFARLQEAAALFLGRHDFQSFGSPTKPGGSTGREVLGSAWERQGTVLLYRVEANSFLYHMVRRIVFALVQAGHGKISVKDLAESIARPELLSVQGLAPAQGLSLVEVVYPGRTPAVGEGGFEKDQSQRGRTSDRGE
jgi:tRNA pseudouridine38-40 synthase